MKQKIKILTLLTAITFTTASCVKDWLDVMPRTMQPAETMFDSYQGYRDALIGCYIKMKSRDLWGEQLTITTVEYLAQHWEIAGNSDRADVFKRHDYEDLNAMRSFQRIYDGLYNVIVQANSILEALPLTGETAIPDVAARSVVAGEAHAIRAMCHFEILRIFGQIPVGGSINVRLPYSKTVSHESVLYYDYANFVGMIEEDMEKALELLGEYDPFVTLTVTQVGNGSYASGTAVIDDFLRFRQLRLNFWAVKALQARFYLYIGETQKAHAAAMDVINVSVEKEFGITDQRQNEDLTSSLYALPSEGLFLLSNHQLSDYIGQLVNGPISPYANHHLSTERMEGGELEYGLFSGEIGTTNNRVRLEPSGIWSRKTTSDGYVVYEPLKYDQSSVSGTGSSLDLMCKKQIMPMLRLSELYLIAMETTNDLTLINSLYGTYWRARDLIPTILFEDKHDVLEMIEREFRCEFFAEGQMFFFYKRKKANRMVWSNKQIAETDYIVPLPKTEFDPNR